MKKNSGVHKKQHQKNPFEKIRSKVETKNILQNFLKTKDKVTLKSEHDVLFYFLPKEVLEDKKVIGFVAYPEPPPGENSRPSIERVSRGTVIGNFSLGKKRYFLSAYINPLDDYYFLLEFTEPLFLLQRRQHQRVQLNPARISAHATITQQNEKPIFLNGFLLDFSKGGALIHLQNCTHIFEIKDQLKMTCHISNRWSFEVQARICHKKMSEKGILFGVEFVPLLSHLSNKLQMIHFELIKKMIYYADEDQRG